MMKDNTSNSHAGLMSRRFLQYSHPSRFSSQTVTGLELSPLDKPAKGEVFFSYILLSQLGFCGMTPHVLLQGFATLHPAKLFSLGGS